MFVQEILHNKINKYFEIKTECSDFVLESNNVPFYKLLPNTYNDIHKVKVRLRKNKNNFTKTFNETFNFSNLRQRAIFSSTELLESEDQLHDCFYIFPINGYKYLYSKEVKNSDKNFQNAFDVILDSFDAEDEATRLVKDLLQYTYTSTSLSESVKNNAEVIFYNIPFYYAVRSDSVKYDELLQSIQ